MRAFGVAIAGLAALCAGYAGAVTPKVVYSTSGIVGNCQYCYGTDIEFGNIPMSSGPFVLQLKAPGIPTVNDYDLVITYHFELYYHDLTPNGTFNDPLDDQILGSDGLYFGFGTKITTGSSYLTEEYNPIIQDQITYGEYLQPFSSDEFEQIINYNLVLGGFDVSLDPIALGQPFSLTISTVPETSTWGLMLFGFGLVGAVLRRRSVDDMSPRPGRNWQPLRLSGFGLGDHASVTRAT